MYHAHAVQYQPNNNTFAMQVDNMKSKQKMSYQKPIKVNFLKVIASRIMDAKSFGIKNLMQVGSNDKTNMAAASLSDVAEDPKKRERFAAQLLDIIQNNEFDGIFIYWKYPGCPAVRNNFLALFDP